jgi:hypothetical protein
MAKANRKTTTSAPTHPARLAKPPYLDPATLPRFYGLRLVGDCMEPDYTHGEKVIFDKEGPLHRCDDAVFFFREAPHFFVVAHIR